MPNGDPSFDFQDMERFFAPIAEAVQDFAANRSLLVRKYYHDGHDWSLRFNHPCGGQASIELIRDNTDRLLLLSIWHYDDYEKFTRFSHVRKPHEVARDPKGISDALQNEFDEILNEKFGNWTHVSSGYEKVWGLWTKEEFSKMAPELPDPLLGH